MPRPAAAVRPYPIFTLIVAALLVLCLAPFRAHAVQNGDRIINVAELHTQQGGPIISTVTVTAVTASAPPKVEFLKYASGTSAATERVGETWYRTAGDAAAPLQQMADLYLPGSTAPTAVPAQIPLVATTVFHQCEPVFVRVTDASQNLDRGAHDTVLVTVTNPTTNQVQVLRLTETGNDTGVFIGYIVTGGEICRSKVPATSYNGYLVLAQAQEVAATYTNNTSGSEVSADAQVDPYGIVFNTLTGEPVNGVSVTLVDGKTGLPATVFGDDGVSPFPATVTTGGTPTDDSGRVYDFPPGRFRFPFVNPGSYRFQVNARGFSAPSAATDAALLALPNGPFTITTGSRLETFGVNPGPALHIDIPVDPLPGTLWLQKSAGKSQVAIGDFLPYQLDLQNSNADATAYQVRLTDTLPPGFRYRSGSTTINGKHGADPAISADGRTLTYTLADLPPGTGASVHLVVEVGAGASLGTAVNVATATSLGAVSNNAQAAVEVQTDFMSTKTLLMGRVGRGPCDLDWDEGVEGVRLYMEDGTFVNTDKNGMYHFEGVRPGTHVVQLDLDSLPEGFEVYRCEENTRFAGRAFSQFVDLQGGTMWRADFRVGRPDDAARYGKLVAERTAKALADEKARKEAEEARKAAQAKKEAEASKMSAPTTAATPADGVAAAAAAKAEEVDEPVVDDWAEPAAPAAPKAAPAPAAHPAAEPKIIAPATAPAPIAAPAPAPAPAPGARVDLVSDLQGNGALFTSAVEVAESALAKTRLEVELPAGLEFTPGSAALNGARLPDPAVHAGTLTFTLGALAAASKESVQFRCTFTPTAPTGEFVTRARLLYSTPSTEEGRTSFAGNVLVRLKGEEDLALPRMELYPHFDTFSADLSSPDREMLDQAALTLAGLRAAGKIRVSQVVLVGHTDNTRIARRSRNVYRDNAALSAARALSVARYLKERLGLTPAQISASGKGESAPVASNKTAAGRAKNRRVEVLVLTEKVAPAQAAQSTTMAGRTPEHGETASAQHPIASAPQLSVTPPAPSAPAVTPDTHLATSDPQAVAAAPVPSALPAAAVSPSAAPAALPHATVAAAQEAVAVKAGGSAAAGGTEGMTTAAPSAPQVAAPPVAAPTTGVGTPAAAAPAATEGKSAAANEPRLEKAGLLSPLEGATLPEPINAVRVVLDSSLTPHLTVDGREISAERIGFTMKDIRTGKSLYSYIGIDFGEPGAHTVTVQGKDPFGVARYEQTVRVVRTGAVAAIRVLETQGNVADGKTPVRIRLQLMDAAGVVIHAATELPRLEGTLRPLKKEGTLRDALEEKDNKVVVDPDGYVSFQPVNASGLYRLVLGTDKVAVEAETYVQPKMSNWILVGLAEGTAGYNAVAGHMENLSSSGTDEDLYENGRIAFYGKGSIQGKWLLTMAYDTAKSRAQVGNSLFQTINPESFYTLYGDASQQQYDASSARKLYLKIERDQFYALFGDFDTNLTVTELSRYSRRLNGIKSEWQGKHLEATVFGADTTQAYARDEIQGDGTSGLYHLTHKPIVFNSDKITVEVRDRFRSEIIVSSKVMNRFTDYSIDYEAGTVFFKEPIHSRDENFNPIIIVAEYETVAAGEKALTLGGRVGAKLLENRVRTGFTYLHEGQVSGSGESFGVDATVKLTPETTLRTEAARTVTDFGSDARHGNAFLAEIKEQALRFQGKAYFREEQVGFGLGQQNGSETGTRKMGADGSYKVSDAFSLAGELYRQYNLATGAVQDLAEAKGTYGSGPYNAHLGMRYANDTLGDGSRETSYQLTSGASWLTLNKRLTLRVDRDQSIGGNSNATYPTRTSFGADYALTEKVTAVARQEFTSGSGADTNTTLVGLKTTPWKGGAVNTTMQRDVNENGDRVFALFGLKQSWKLTEKWSVDGGVDRSQTVRHSGHYTFNVNAPAAQGSTEDFTAVSLGSTYDEKKWSWSNRVEYRTATSEDKWGVESAFIGEPKEGWGWSSRLRLFDTESAAGDRNVQGDLRLGLAYRPLRTRWIILDRLDFIYGNQETAGTKLESRRVVNNLNANFQPNSRTQLSLQYGAKYAMETIDNVRYSAFTDLVGVEGRYDLTKTWDVGVRGSILHSWGLGQAQYGSGISVGYNVMKNAWVSVGYNLTGFSDQDFSAANYTAQGPYMRFRMKFDQESVKEAVKWVNQQ